VRQIHAGQREANRLGAGCEQQSVVGDSASVIEHHLTGRYVDELYIRPETQLNGALFVKIERTQRDPLFRRVAGKIILGQIGPVHGRGLVAAKHDDTARVLLTTQHLGRGETGGSATDDDDPSRQWVPRCGAATPLRNRGVFLRNNKDLAIARLDRPTSDGAQCRRVQRFAGAQAEAGMPGRDARSKAKPIAWRPRRAEQDSASVASGGDPCAGCGALSLRSHVHAFAVGSPKGPLPRAAARLLASRATKQIARKAPSHPGFGAMASSASLRSLRIVRTIRCAATPRI